jgi:xanthine dehydrogenase accessory factor
MDTADLLAINEAIEAALGRGPAVFVATVTGAGEPPFLGLGAKLLVSRDGQQIGSLGRPEVDATVELVAAEAYTALPRIGVETLYVAQNGATTRRRHEARPGAAEVMLQLWEQPASLIVVGGGHVGLALATFGEQLDFAVTVIDDREDFANRDRFPMAEHVLCGDLAELLDEIVFDGTSHIVLVSRGHLQDELALRHAVGRGAGYVGMIGSRRRTATVLQHLLSEGYEAAVLDSVSTPIGLDIGAETPEEIALSILAEIVMLRGGRSGARLHDHQVHLLEPPGESLA